MRDQEHGNDGDEEERETCPHPPPPWGAGCRVPGERWCFSGCGGGADGRRFGRKKLQRQRWREAASLSGNVEESGVLEACSVEQSCEERLMGQGAWWVAPRAAWSRGVQRPGSPPRLARPSPSHLGCAAPGCPPTSPPRTSHCLQTTTIALRGSLKVTRSSGATEVWTGSKIEPRYMVFKRH